MKKLLIVLAFASVSLTSMAQDMKYSVATNSFWSNWFIQVGGNWNAWYVNEEHGNDFATSPLKDFRSAPGASVAIGKWFTPGLGLRTRINGIWGKTVLDDVADDDNEYKYWTAQEQVLFNLSNMLCGYNPTRVWNFIPFLGGGISRNMTHDFYAMGLSAGILNEFRLSRKVALNLELGYLYAEPDFDGCSAGTSSNRGWDIHDNQLYAELGLTFNLGKATWNKVPDIDAINALHEAQVASLMAQLNDANNEIGRLNNLIKNHKCKSDGGAVTKFVSAPVSVFFDRGKSTPSKSYDADMVDVRALVEVAKANDLNLLVTGYADSSTGNDGINDPLSEARAERVANEIVGMGFSRDRIQTAARGGVDIISPVFDRRATVEIK